MGFDKCICLISIEVIVVSLNPSSVLGVIVRSLGSPSVHSGDHGIT